MDSDTDANRLVGRAADASRRASTIASPHRTRGYGLEDDVEAVPFGSDLGSAEERHPPAHELAIELEQLRRRDGTVAFNKLGVPAQIREEEAAGRDACLVTLGCANLGFRLDPRRHFLDLMVRMQRAVDRVCGNVPSARLRTLA